MTLKTRNVMTKCPYVYNGVPLSYTNTLGVTTETMADSSPTGSARTGVDSVDRFLSKPTNHHDFMSALRESHKTAGDAGNHEFSVKRTGYLYSNISGATKAWYDVTPNEFSGSTLSVGVSDGLFPPLVFPSHPSQADRKTTGQELYLRALPNRDQAALGTVLGEIISNPVRALVIPGAAVSKVALRQGRHIQERFDPLTRHRHSRIRDMPLEQARATADDYLAYIFGARPTVNDLDKLAESISSSRRLARTVSRDGTRRIRRRRSLPTVSLSAQSFNPTSVNYVYVNTPYNRDTLTVHGTDLKRTEFTKNSWWSGSYRMSVADTDHWLDRCSNLFQYIDRLTGIGLDVKVAWDLIPFSFMADWFANTGEFLENRTVIADYNIACEYGYIMCHTRVERTLIVSGVAHFLRVPGDALSASVKTFTETKTRDAAGSFGFQTDFDNLNSYQWGALTALGLSGLPGVRPSSRS